MIQHRFPFTAMLTFLLAARSPVTTVAPTFSPTAAIIPTEAKVPTRTATVTPSPTPTETPAPIPNPLLESAFSVQVVGYSEHGAMIELFYDGEWSELVECQNPYWDIAQIESWFGYVH